MARMTLTRILADCYFDSETAQLIRRETILEVSQDTGLIHKICTCGPEDDQESKEPQSREWELIDLRGLTVLPGFVDTHVHRQFIVHLPALSIRSTQQYFYIPTPKRLGRINSPRKAWLSARSGRLFTPTTPCWQASPLSET